nr:MAG TPA: hypothetical protein [Caudoviricetes sp.]
MQWLTAEYADTRAQKSGIRLRKIKGGDLKLSEIHNYLVNAYGGGVYACIVNANDSMLVDKVSDVLMFDVCDIPELTE